MRGDGEIHRRPTARAGLEDRDRRQRLDAALRTVSLSVPRRTRIWRRQGRRVADRRRCRSGEWDDGSRVAVRSRRSRCPPSRAGLGSPPGAVGGASAGRPRVHGGRRHLDPSRRDDRGRGFRTARNSSSAAARWCVRAGRIGTTCGAGRGGKTLSTARVLLRSSVRSTKRCPAFPQLLRLAPSAFRQCTYLRREPDGNRYGEVVQR
jgi:hypothetical protein